MSDSVTSALTLMVIAYPMVFVVMAVFAVLTHFLDKAFPGK